MSLERKSSLSVHLIPFLNERVSLDELSQIYMRQAILFCGGNKSQAATLLGMSRNAVMQTIDVLGWDELKGNLDLAELLRRNIISMNDYRKWKGKRTPG
jgi:DNA-binding NtrC family response regulator